MNSERPNPLFKGLHGDVIRTFLFQILAHPLGIAQSILIARVLGPTGRGTYALVIMCASLVSTTLGGINAAIAFQVSKGQVPIPKVMANGLALSVILSLLLLFIVGVGSAWWGESTTWLRFAAIGATITFFIACFNGLFLGKSDIRGLNFAQLITVSSTLLLSAVMLLGFRMGVHGALSAWIGASVLTLAWLWWRSGLKLRNTLPHDLAADSMKSLLLFTLQIGGTNAIGFLNYRADSFMVEHLIGVRALGIYTVAVGVAEVLWLVSRATTVACYGRLGRESTSEATLLAAKVIRHTGPALLIVGLCIGTVGPFLLPLVYGFAFQEAVPVLLILLPGNICYGLASILSAYFSNHLGRPEISLGIAGLSLAINLCACLVLIPRFGTIGGALASSLSYIISIAIASVLFVRMGRISWRETLLLTRNDWKGYAQLLRTVGGREA